MRRKLARVVGCAGGLLLLAVAWLLFAPQPLGGSVAYAVISGDSMEPKLHAGDLAVLRTRGGYEPGDVVAYRSEELDRVVLHRIVRREGDRFVFKGDGNEWLDSERPDASEIVGELWVNAPQVGRVLGHLHDPRVAAGVIALLALPTLAFSRARWRRRERESKHLRRRRAPRWTVPAAVPVTVLAFTAAGSGGVAWAGLTKPDVRVEAADVGYEQRGEFTYSARTEAGPVYAEGRVTTGETVYLRMVNHVRFAFDYQFDATVPHEIAGSVRLAAELREPDGWHTRLPLGPASAVRDGRAEVVRDVDLGALRSVIDKVEAQTGIERDVYALQIMAAVDVSGTVAGQPVQETWSSPMAFELDDLRLKPAAAGTVAPPARSGTVHLTHDEANPLVLPGLELSRSEAAVVGLVGSGIAVLGLGLVGVRIARRRARDDTAVIQARHGGVLVRVASLPDARLVQLASPEALARIADQYERLILHASDEDGDAYLVEHDGVGYMYRVPT